MDEKPMAKAEEAADRLEGHLGIRLLPRPPVFLISDSPDELARRGFPSAGMVDVVAPHWDQAIRQLGPDGQGAQALLQMRDRIQSWAAEAEAQEDLLEGGLSVLEAVENAIAEEAKVHGTTALAGTSLGKGAPAPPSAWWQWSPDGGGDYVLEAATPDDAWKRYAPSVRTYLKVYAFEDWAAVSERVCGAISQTRNELVPYQKRVAVCRFRVRVIEQVLREHDLLGYVGPLDERRVHVSQKAAPDISAYGLDDRLFILVAAEAVEADPKCEVKRSGILRIVDEQLEESGGSRTGGLGGTSWYEGKARRVASRPHIGAYEVQSDKGTRPSDDSSEILAREAFGERVRELAAQLHEAGVKSVADILD